MIHLVVHGPGSQKVQAKMSDNEVQNKSSLEASSSADESSVSEAKMSGVSEPQRQRQVRNFSSFSTCVKNRCFYERGEKKNGCWLIYNLEILGLLHTV